MDRDAWIGARRARQLAGNAIVALALLAPIRQHLRPRRDQVDAYPLSFYPMFRRRRPQRVTISHAVGIDGEGKSHYLTDRVMVANVGFNQARHQLNRAVRAGRADAQATALAERVATDPTLGHIVRVDIGRGRFDLDSCLLGDRALTCEEMVSVAASVAVGDRIQPDAPDVAEAEADVPSPGTEPPPDPGAAGAPPPPDVTPRRSRRTVVALIVAVAVAAAAAGGRGRLPSLARRAGFTDSAPAESLGLVRFVTGGYTFVHLLINRAESRDVHRSEVVEFTPTGPVRVLSRPVSPSVADGLNDAAILSSAFFALGIWHRAIGPVHAALLTWTQSYRNSWGMVFHTTNALVAHTVILGTSPAADAISLPTLRRAPGPPHERYALPLATMRLASAIAYLLAGIAKIWQRGGWTWVKGDALRRHVAINAVRKILYGEDPGSMAIRLHRHRWLWTAAAAGSLVLELVAPLVLLNRRIGRVWVVAMLGLHWGIYAIMRIRFPYQMSGVSFAAWLDRARPVGIR